ncbi:MAG: hypothetical protein HY722_01535 [Planctomycetes bacterium]|nr:hypothetical protein [Planctomycetota bacterium]
MSFLSALIHHGALVDAMAVVQVASPERSGRMGGTSPGPVEFIPIPRDLHHGWRVEPFEGEVVPVAGVEKALVDWLWWAEERGLDPRLEEMEWDRFDLHALARLLAETGVTMGEGPPRTGEGPCHDQARARAEALRATFGVTRAPSGPDFARGVPGWSAPEAL